MSKAHLVFHITVYPIGLLRAEYERAFHRERLPSVQITNCDAVQDHRFSLSDHDKLIVGRNVEAVDLLSDPLYRKIPTQNVPGDIPKIGSVANGSGLAVMREKVSPHSSSQLGELKNLPKLAVPLNCGTGWRSRKPLVKAGHVRSVPIPGWLMVGLDRLDASGRN